MNGFRRLTPKIVLAAALALLPACSPRQPIPTAPGDARPEAEVRAERQHRASKQPQPAQPQLQGPVEETVVAEVRDPQTTDAQIKTAVAKAEARHADPLDEALAEEADKAQPAQGQAAASKPAGNESTPTAQQPATKAEADHAATEAAKPAGAKPGQDAANGAAPEASAAKGLMVQIASFGAEKNADAAIAWLKDMGYAQSRKVRVDQGGTSYVRVQAGPFQDPAAARKALEQLKADWPQAFIPAD